MEIPDRDKHEAEFAARIARLTGRYRKELLNDLGSGKNLGQIAGDFWLRVQGDMQSELAGILSGLFTRAAEANSGLIPSDLLGELEDDLLDAAREWSISRAVEVARDWVLNSISILTRRARDWLANPDAMVDDLARVFGAKRAARLAATELTLAQTAGIGGSGTGGIIDQGGKWGMAFERIWRSERDSRVCPICRRFHNTPEEAWGSVAKGLVGDDHLSQRMADRIIAQGGPPGHANCRCFLKVRGVDGRKMSDGSGGLYDVAEAFDPSQPRDENGRWSSDPLTDSIASEVIPAMRRIATGADRGELVSARELRKQFPTMPKETFDFMAATLSKAGILSLHRHDYVANLTDTERDELIHDPEADDYGHSGRDGLKGAYYIGVNIRQ